MTKLISQVKLFYVNVDNGRQVLEDHVNDWLVDHDDVIIERIWFSSQDMETHDYTVFFCAVVYKIDSAEAKQWQREYAEAIEAGLRK